MIAFERRQRILRILQQQPGIRVSALAKTLAVTEATVRNDLSTLEAEAKVQRVRGGAILIEPPSPANRTRCRDGERWTRQQAQSAVGQPMSSRMATPFSWMPARWP